MSSEPDATCPRSAFPNLPREIRNLIYKVVLQPELNSSSIPPGTSCICDQKLSAGDDEFYKRNTFPSGTFDGKSSNALELGDDPPRRSFLSILRANKQIYQEAAECLYNGPVSLDCSQSGQGAHVAFVNRANTHCILPRVVLNHFTTIRLRFATSGVSGLMNVQGYRIRIGEKQLRESFLPRFFINRLEAEAAALRSLHFEYWFKFIDLQKDLGPTQQLADLISTHREIYQASRRLGAKAQLSSFVHVCMSQIKHDIQVVEGLLDQVEHGYEGFWCDQETKEDRDERFKKREEQRLKHAEGDRGPIQKRVCRHCQLVTWTEADREWSSLRSDQPGFVKWSLHPDET